MSRKLALVMALIVLVGMLGIPFRFQTLGSISPIEIQTGNPSNYYTFTMDIMGEHYSIAIETNGTIEAFHHTNFAFGWNGLGGSFYNITIPKTLNNTRILATCDGAFGAFEPSKITMNDTHYFVYYYSDWWVEYISHVIFGAPTVKLSISTSTTYIGFKVDIKGNVTCKEKPVANWPVILVAYIAPLRGNVWAWQWTSLPLTLITVVNTTSDGHFSAVWMPTATGTWWVSAGLANPWPSTDGDYPEDASDSASLTVISYDATHVFSVVSNATVSALAFNSTSKKLTFTVEGASGGKGFVDVYISKTLLEDPTGLIVYLNLTQLSHEQYTVGSTDDSWSLHLEMSFASKYNVIVVIPEFPSTIDRARGLEPAMLFMLTIGIVIAIVTIAVVVLFARKKPPAPPPPAVPVKCPECGVMLKPEAAFCPSCGRRVR